MSDARQARGRGKVDIFAVLIGAAAVENGDAVADQGDDGTLEMRREAFSGLEGSIEQPRA
jgi:hypothetical protein